jgi:hypothetical protein
MHEQAAIVVHAQDWDADVCLVVEGGYPYIL